MSASRSIRSPHSEEQRIDTESNCLNVSHCGRSCISGLQVVPTEEEVEEQHRRNYDFVKSAIFRELRSVIIDHLSKNVSQQELLDPNAGDQWTESHFNDRL